MVKGMTYNLDIKKVNIAEAKTHFLRYLDIVENGETVVVSRRNVPIAEVHPVPKPCVEERPVGIDRGRIVPASFFEPLPDDLLDAFEGGGGSEWGHSSGSTSGRTASAHAGIRRVNCRIAAGFR